MRRWQTSSNHPQLGPFIRSIDPEVGGGAIRVPPTLSRVAQFSVIKGPACAEILKAGSLAAILLNPEARPETDAPPVQSSAGPLKEPLLHMLSLIAA